MTSDNRMANHILGELNRKITPQIHQNAEIVDGFVNGLRAQLMNRQGTLLSKANIMHSGSAYETLSVNAKTDFDVILVLPTPYQAENFKVECDPSHFLRLRMNPNSTASSYVDAAKLQSQLFEELSMCLKRVSVPRVRSVSGKEGLAAYTVEIITTSDTKISVDLVPQIAAQAWGEYLRPLEELPAKLQGYVKMLERNASPIYFFSAAVPGNHPNQNSLFNISFSMLEKQFLRSNTNIRDMVRLVKLVGEVRGWPKKYGLKSFCIKRLALKFSDDLQNKLVWDGYRILLERLISELKSYSVIGGYFIPEPVAYKKKPEKIQELCNEISEVYHLNSSQVYLEVKGYIGC